MILEITKLLEEREVLEIRSAGLEIEIILWDRSGIEIVKSMHTLRIDELEERKVNSEKFDKELIDYLRGLNQKYKDEH